MQQHDSDNNGRRSFVNGCAKLLQPNHFFTCRNQRITKHFQCTPSADIHRDPRKWHRQCGEQQ
ncbi:Uncharacterised protein [Vibrio cholerae]|nr:Uncharacterised protein [Vibrio cholerae]